MPGGPYSQDLYLDVGLDGIVYSCQCKRNKCKRGHTLDGISIQLNPCCFREECFLHEAVVENTGYIYNSVSKGFNIVDSEFRGLYYCRNYDSILNSEFKSQMDATLKEELETGKVSLFV